MGSGDASEAAARIRAYEHRFRAAGLPLFIAGYSASTDIFNRAAPLLGLVFAGEVLGAGQLDWPLWQNALAVVGGLAILLLAIALINRAAGRPFRAIPERIGKTELAGFVIAPALLPLIFGGQAQSAIVTLIGNLALLALIYGVLGYGLLAILRWVMNRLWRQLAASFALLTRAIPLLMIFSLVLFLTTEVWEVFTSIPDVTLAMIGALFVGLGASFLVARVPREVRALELEAGEGDPPLERRQRVNVGLVLFVSQAVQVLFVALAVGIFFTAFGMLAIEEVVRESWIGTEGNAILEITISGDRIQLTEELLRVAGGIAAFTGLYFAISMLTDSTYREEFLDELTTEMTETFHARGEYLALLRGGERQV